VRHTRISILAVAATLVAVAVATAPANPANAIINGTETSPAYYPYFVKVSSSTGLCGGTLIAPTAVLTAAHCLYGESGSPQLTFPGRGTVAGGEVFLHPLYDGDFTDGYDVAVVTVAQSFGAPVAQAGAPWDPGAYQADQYATIMGYGHNTPDGGSGTFRTAIVPVRSDSDMADIYDPWYWVDDWKEPLMIGAGIGQITTCIGDSGAPLIKQRTYPVVIGVVSFGNGGCGTAGAFAEIANQQLAWIASRVPSITNMWGPCTQPNGQPGQSYTNYGYYTPGAAQDGPYWWIISCVGTPPPPPSAPPAPPLPPGCKKCVEQ
jgi:hypothetical protein